MYGYVFTYTYNTLTYVYIYMCVCMYVRTYVRMYVCMLRLAMEPGHSIQFLRVVFCSGNRLNFPSVTPCG